MSAFKFTLTKLSWATEARMEQCNRLPDIPDLESLDRRFVLKPIIFKSI